jgi:hypothetical protein
MNKIITWLGAGTMALTIGACGGKVVVDGAASNTGGAGGTGTGGTTTSGNPQACGDLVIPSPVALTPCGVNSTAGSSGGMTKCETDFCDANGNIFGAVCTGPACACTLNGETKCTCAANGVTDFCSTTACCPWLPIPF